MKLRRSTALTTTLLALLAVLCLLPTAQAFHHPRLGRFVQRDPLGYVDGMSTYQYCYSRPVHVTDPSGRVVEGWGHSYPLHLGGKADQPVFWLLKENHIAQHQYFRSCGFGPGDAGRQAWKALTKAQQKEHIIKGMRAAKIPEKFITGHIDDILKGAKPGVKIARGKLGKKILLSALGSGVLVFMEVMLHPSTAYAAEIPKDWRGNATSGPPTKDAKYSCECAIFEADDIQFKGITNVFRNDIVGADTRKTEWSESFMATAEECMSCEGSLPSSIKDSVPHMGTLMINTRWIGGYKRFVHRVSVKCRFGGKLKGRPDMK